MANAYRDENGVPTLICASNADGQTPVRIYVDPTTHGLAVNDGTTGSDAGNNGGNAQMDDNGVPVLIAVSSVDGVTPVEVYGDPATGKIFINSN